MLLATDAPRIQQLSQSVINKIAAGEVIERPASVVKELLENSVDALATRITVEIEAGGAELIRITDDGEGIHPDDIELAVTAHATSKLRGADDLFRVRTMGFRGEALASIAEVSRFRLRSRRAEQLTGMEVDVEAGILKEPRACGCPVGTSIEVRQLFLNTPVRRKFLRTASTEFAHIAEQFTRIALANPNLHLTLRHNDKTTFDLPASPQLIERLEVFYGSELAGKLIPVDASVGEARLWGFVGHPSQSRSNRKGQYLFLNGRAIQDRSLQHALGEAYRGLLMTGRYPLSFLFLEVPADDVDVNVHPTKSEVRFRDSSALYRLILTTLRTRFLGMDIGRGHKLEAGAAIRDGGFGPHDDVPTSARQALAQQELVNWAESQIKRWQPNNDLSDLTARVAEPSPAAFEQTSTTGNGDDSAGTPDDIAAAIEETLSGGFGRSNAADGGHDSETSGVLAPASRAVAAASPDREIPQTVRTVETAESRMRPASAGAELRAMQVHDCYLVVETGDGLTVIDQHALHERILYEHFRDRVLNGSVEVQRLLIPLPLELSPRETGLLLDQQELLRELGLLVEEFGRNTIAVTGYPTMMRRASPDELVRVIVELLEENDGRVSRRDLLDSLLHMMACKAAIKAGQRLKPDEIESLLAQRHLVDDAHHCPHGRPTALTLSRMELDRQFGRLG
ncbi:MAG: DNA mismatch repair endonuclease MutL [Planctomycetaceae bacterium]